MKALVLMSGGLDSVLAAKLLLEQGIEVTGICFYSPAFGCEDARNACKRLGIELIEIDMTESLINIIKRPKRGFGKNLNPCIDCHACMISEAIGLLEKTGASFVATGEVLGERPMSQNRQSLEVVARESGRPELVLRPLSALLLEPTLPENSGWVRREMLLGLQGRSRKQQLELAERWGIDWYRSPAGGCLLTDSAYSEKLRLLLERIPEFDRHDFELVRLGRHFWSGNNRIILGRNARENEELVKLALPTDLLLKESGSPGPLALVRSIPRDRPPGKEVIEEAAMLLGRYGKRRRPLKSEEIREYDPSSDQP